MKIEKYIIHAQAVIKRNGSFQSASLDLEVSDLETTNPVKFAVSLQNKLLTNLDNSLPKKLTRENNNSSNINPKYNIWPGEKQISYAKSLGIQVSNKITKRDLSKLIENKLHEKT